MEDCMMKPWRQLATAAALSAVVVFTGSTAQAQECQPGIWTAFEAHADQYNALWFAMGPGIQDISNAMAALSDELHTGRSFPTREPQPAAFQLVVWS